MAVYVDNTILTGKTKMAIGDLIGRFKGDFEIRVSELIDRILGNDCGRQLYEIKLHNQPTIECLLQFFCMEHCKSVETPLAAGLDLTSLDGVTLTKAAPHRQHVAALMHLANTSCPDIVFT